eukprot:jgi/Tetstr1/449610/TSEL_036697.t1
MCTAGGVAGQADDPPAATPRSDTNNVKVVVRVRPNLDGSASALALRDPKPVILLRQPSPVRSAAADSRKVTMSPSMDRMYEFDALLGPERGQEDVFSCVGKPLVENCLAGFNSTVMAYGSTGSGKTHTMLGDFPGHSPSTTPRSPISAAERLRRRLSLGRRKNSSSSRKGGGSAPRTATPSPPATEATVGEDGEALSSSAGLTPRVFEYLFSRIEELCAEQPGARFTVRASLYEIYNEIITDLLSRRSNLPIRRVDGAGADAAAVHVEGAEEREIAGLRGAMELVANGLANRNVAGTARNEASSRSHAVLSCVIESRIPDGTGGMSLPRRATLNLVDLAGSERQQRSGTAGQRLREAASINKSLSALGHVVSHVVEGSRHVPYRDSKLTHLLQDSLGGNAKTVLIAAVNPCAHSMQETESTLGFAARAGRMFHTAVASNFGDAEKDMAALKTENAQLRAALKDATVQATKMAGEIERLQHFERAATGEESPNASVHTGATHPQQVSSCHALEGGRVQGTSPKSKQSDGPDTPEQEAPTKAAYGVPRLQLEALQLAAGSESDAGLSEGSMEFSAGSQRELCMPSSRRARKFRLGRSLRHGLVPVSILAAGVLGASAVTRSGRRRGKALGIATPRGVYRPAGRASTASGLKSARGSRKPATAQQRNFEYCARGGNGCVFGVPDPIGMTSEELAMARF